MSLEAVALALAGLVAVFEALAYLGKSHSLFRSAWRRTPYGRRRWAEKRLSKLCPNVQHTYFAQLLDLTPVYKSLSGGYNEYVFVDRDFWVKAVTDDLDQVQLYTVTTRSTKFNPPLWPNNVSARSHPRPKAVRLGRATFLEIAPQHVGGIDLFVRGATSPTHYVECSYLGNPGLYQHYFVGLNELGPFDFDTQKLYALVGRQLQLGVLASTSQADNRNKELSDWLSESNVVAFRSSAKPNTYGVSGPGFPPRADDYEVYLGPDPVQMRTLLE